MSNRVGYRRVARLQFLLQVLQLIATLAIAFLISFQEFTVAFLISVVLVGLYILTQYFGSILSSYKRPNLNELLFMCLQSVFPTQKTSNYRINVWVEKPRHWVIKLIKKSEELLQIKFSYNMHHTDQLLELKIGQGATGKAFQNMYTVKVDLTDFTHEDFGLSDQQKQMIWKLMKSIISIPIPLREEQKVIGVLTIDSSLEFEEAKFHELEVEEKLMKYADLIGKLLLSYI